MLFDSLEICRGNYNPLRVMTASNPHSVETLGSCPYSEFRNIPSGRFVPILGADEIKSACADL